MTFEAGLLFLKGAGHFIAAHWRAFALAGLVLAFFVSLEIAHSRGYTAGKAASEAAQAKLQAAADARAHAADAQFQKDTANAKGFYNGIGAELVPVLARPGYQLSCFDADGVRLANQALAGPAGRSRPAVPGSDAPHR